MAKAPQQNLSERRLVENEVIFREVNKSVQQFADEEMDASSSTPLSFYCECANPDCTERIPMTAARYKELHVGKKLFVVLPGHVFPRVETVVKKEPDFQVVEKHFDPPKPEEITLALKSIKV